MANDLIPYKLWLERTKLSMKSRSDALKKLDSELERYEKFGGSQAMWAVGQALEAWKKTKGPGDEWKKSARNKNHAFEDLTKALEGFHHTDEDKQAIAVVKAHQKEFLKALFEGRKVALSSKLVTAYQVGSSAYKIDQLVAQARGGDSGASGARKEAWDLVHNAVGDVIDTPELAEVLSEIVGDSLSGLVTSITPAVGLVKSAGMTLYNGVKTASKGKKLFKIRNADDAFAPGDPEAALAAVRALLKRELANSAAKTAAYAAETGGKAAGMFADGGTATTAAVGIAASLTRLLITLNALRVDVLEMRAANKILKHPDRIDASIFGKAPLLGCYFLCCADTATMVNFMFEDVGRPGFKYEVEKACKSQLEPTLKIASHMVLNHRMMLNGGELPKLSVIATGKSAATRIAVRSPGTVMHLKAKAANKVRRREMGYYK